MKLHFIYDCLLRKYLTLTTSDARAIRKGWQMPEGQAESILVRSAPSPTARLFACHDLDLKFDLHGVPGFYAVKAFDGISYRWELNLPQFGLVRPYYDHNRRICGLVVYRSADDREPRLLSSAKLLLGAKALPYNPLYDHELIHEHRITQPRPSPRPGFAGYGTGRAVGQEARGA